MPDWRLKNAAERQEYYNVKLQMNKNPERNPPRIQTEWNHLFPWLLESARAVWTMNSSSFKPMKILKLKDRFRILKRLIVNRTRLIVTKSLLRATELGQQKGNLRLRSTLVRQRFYDLLYIISKVYIIFYIKEPHFIYTYFIYTFYV